jgi:hypothetical protein
VLTNVVVLVIMLVTFLEIVTGTSAGETVVVVRVTVLVLVMGIVSVFVPDVITDEVTTIMLNRAKLR